MSSPDLVDNVFGSLLGLFGSAWTMRISTGTVTDEGDDEGVIAARVEWSRALAGFTATDVAVAIGALRRSRVKQPPTAPEFRGLCLEAHQRGLRVADFKDRQALPAPAHVREQQRENAEASLAKAKSLLAKGGTHASGALGLLALVAESIALAGGDDKAAALSRLERDVLRKGRMSLAEAAR